MKVATLGIKCARRGCTAPAKVAPRINVPGQHHPIVSKETLKVTFSLPLCRLHGAELKSADFLDDDVRAAIVDAATRAEKEPDFDRAFVSTVPLDDPDYLKVTRLRHAAEGH